MQIRILECCINMDVCASCLGLTGIAEWMCTFHSICASSSSKTKHIRQWHVMTTKIHSEHFCDKITLLLFGMKGTFICIFRYCKIQVHVKQPPPCPLSCRYACHMSEHKMTSIFAGRDKRRQCSSFPGMSQKEVHFPVMVLSSTADLFSSFSVYQWWLHLLLTWRSLLHH